MGGVEQLLLKAFCLGSRESRLLLGFCVFVFLPVPYDISKLNFFKSRSVLYNTRRTEQCGVSQPNLMNPLVSVSGRTSRDFSCVEQEG